jgi:hypothetical protein
LQYQAKTPYLILKAPSWVKPATKKFLVKNLKSVVLHEIQLIIHMAVEQKLTSQRYLYGVE